MSLRKLALIISLIISFTNYSQNKMDTSVVSGTFFPKYSGEKKWKVFFDLDARRSSYLEQKIKINGIRIGANYKGVNRFGIGLYALKDKINIQGIEVNKLDAAIEPDVKVTFSITTFFFEKVFFKSKRWEISFPTYLGVGSANSEYKNNFGNYKLLKQEGFSVIGLGVNTNYYILPWLYPRLTLGYRFAFNPDENIAKSFTKPFYAIGVSLNPWGAYQHFKSWKKDKKANQSLND